MLPVPALLFRSKRPGRGWTWWQPARVEQHDQHVSRIFAANPTARVVTVEYDAGTFEWKRARRG